MNCLLVLSLAVLGASASPCGLNFNTVSGVSGSSGISGVSGVAVSALPGRNIFVQTPVVENPTAVFPSIIPPTSVSQSCHCLKTIVRPQIRNEIITVPQIDRVVRVVPSPVVEAISVNVGGNTRNAQLPTFGLNYGVSGGLLDGASGISGIVSGSYPRIVESGVVGASLQGFNGVINSGIVGNVAGCGCGSNIIV